MSGPKESRVHNDRTKLKPWDFAWEEIESKGNIKFDRQSEFSDVPVPRSPGTNSLLTFTIVIHSIFPIQSKSKFHIKLLKIGDEDHVQKTESVAQVLGSVNFNTAQFSFDCSSPGEIFKILVVKEKKFRRCRDIGAVVFPHPGKSINERVLALQHRDNWTNVLIKLSIVREGFCAPAIEPSNIERMSHSRQKTSFSSMKCQSIPSVTLSFFASFLTSLKLISCFLLYLLIIKIFYA